MVADCIVQLARNFIDARGEAMSRFSLKLTAFVLVVVGAGSSAGADDAPTLSGLDYMNPYPGVFVIIGHVNDENPGGCLVIFSGVLDGHSCSPDPDGKIEYAVFLDEGDMGTVYAESRDGIGQNSNEDSTTLAW